MTSNNVGNSFSEIEQPNIALVRRYVKTVWNQQQTNVIYELFSPDFIYHYEHLESRGVNAWVEEFYQPLINAFSNINMQVDDIYGQNDMVTYRWSAKVVHTGSLFGLTPSGKEVQITGISWLKIIDAGNYRKSLEESAPYFRRQFTPELWEEILNTTRKPLGRILSRKIKLKFITQIY